MGEKVPSPARILLPPPFWTAVLSSLWGSPQRLPERVGQAWAAGSGSGSRSARTRVPARGDSGPRPRSFASGGSAPEGAFAPLDSRTPAHPTPRPFSLIPEASRLGSWTALSRGAPRALGCRPAPSSSSEAQCALQVCLGCGSLWEPRPPRPLRPLRAPSEGLEQARVCGRGYYFRCANGIRGGGAPCGD